MRLRVEAQDAANSGMLVHLEAQILYIPACLCIWELKML